MKAKNWIEEKNIKCNKVYGEFVLPINSVYKYMELYANEQKVMKLYELEFTFFDGVIWKEVTIKILAVSKIQLMRSFLEQTESLAYHKDTSSKKLWNECKNNIEEISLPIITTKIYK